MITFCILCRSEIPEDRQRRGATTCSPEHAKEYRRQRRASKALLWCRLCGRKARITKVGAPTTTKVPIMAVAACAHGAQQDLITDTDNKIEF